METTSQTVDRSQADGPTATRSQQQKAAAVQKAVAARKQRYLACAFARPNRLIGGHWRRAMSAIGSYWRWFEVPQYLRLSG
jgi:hypothetical protein